MSKKDRLLDRLKSWHSHSDKAITAFMALAGFTFTSAGGFNMRFKFVLCVFCVKVVLIIVLLLRLFIEDRIRFLVDFSVESSQNIFVLITLSLFHLF